MSVSFEQAVLIERYDRLYPGDLDAVVALLSDAFCSYDPLEIALSIAPEEFSVMLNLELPIILQSHLSTGLRCEGSQDLIGVMIGYDMKGEKIESQNRISSKFKPISHLVGSLYNKYVGERKLLPEKTMYIYMLGIARDYMGLGLSKKLISESVSRAKQNNFKSVFAITTNSKSLRAFKNEGFKEVSFIKYSEFEYCGEKIFSSIGNSEQASLVEKWL